MPAISGCSGAGGKGSRARGPARQGSPALRHRGPAQPRTRVHRQPQSRPGSARGRRSRGRSLSVMSSHPPGRFDPGRPFVHPVFDYLLIGGGMSLLVMAWLMFERSPSLRLWLQTNLWTLVLLSNSAHFAGSTVRLYTKPGSFRDLPFLTMGLPLASVGVLTLAIAWPGGLGRHLQSLYLTWSPYHYAAQAYGLAAMYCYRSGSTWTEAAKRCLRLACFVPF